MKNEKTGVSTPSSADSKKSETLTKATPVSLPKQESPKIANSAAPIAVKEAPKKENILLNEKKEDAPVTKLEDKPNREYQYRKINPTLNRSEQGKIRRQMRSKRRTLLNGILKSHAAGKKEDLAKDIKEFMIFYRNEFTVNDLSLKSVYTGPSIDEANEVEAALEIIRKHQEEISNKAKK